jgi:hypothetical protein
LNDRFGGNENDLGGSLVRTEGSGVIDEDLVRTAREVASHSTGTPNLDQSARVREGRVHVCARRFQSKPERRLRLWPR